MREFLKDDSNLVRLEKKLQEIEKTSPISNDAELIRAIDAIIDAECELPDDERDYGLIDEAIKMEASLRGIDLAELEGRANLSAEKAILEIQQKHIQKK